MAKLTTPAHQCSIAYVGQHGAPTGQHCPIPAYRRLDGKWLCRKHLQRAKARAASPFTVVGTYTYRPTP